VELRTELQACTARGGRVSIQGFPEPRLRQRSPKPLDLPHLKGDCSSTARSGMKAVLNNISLGVDSFIRPREGNLSVYGNAEVQHLLLEPTHPRRWPAPRRLRASLIRTYLSFHSGLL
jgi:hypothetical protein